MRFLLLLSFGLLFFAVTVFAEKGDENVSGEKKTETTKAVKKLKSEQNLWLILREFSPEDRKRLRQLHTTDPKAFREEVAVVFKRIQEQELKKKQLQAEELRKKQQLRELVRAYKKSSDSAEKEKILKQLRDSVRETFMVKLEKNGKRLESLEKHVEKLRKQYEERKQNADKIIEQRVNKLIGANRSRR